MIKDILDLASFLSLLIAGFYALAFAVSIIIALQRAVQTRRFSFFEFLRNVGRAVFPKTVSLKAVIAIGAIVVLGAGNMIAQKVATEMGPGSFYEPEEYWQWYDAQISVTPDIDHGPCRYDSKIRVMANVHKWDGLYRIEELRLPYGVYLDEYLEIASLEFGCPYKMRISDQEILVYITIIAPATEATMAAMDDETCQYSVVVGSRHSGTAHSPQCPMAAQILQENQLWFSSGTEARIFGYKYCELCERAEY